MVISVKNYIKYLIFALIIFVPFNVFAASNTSVVISCGEASVGETFTCDLNGYVGNAYVNYFTAKYDISAIFTLTDFKYAEGLSGGPLFSKLPKACSFI